MQRIIALCVLGAALQACDALNDEMDTLFVSVEMQDGSPVFSWGEKQAVHSLQVIKSSSPDFPGCRAESWETVWSIAIPDDRVKSNKIPSPVTFPVVPSAAEELSSAQELVEGDYAVVVDELTTDCSIDGKSCVKPAARGCSDFHVDE